VTLVLVAVVLYFTEGVIAAAGDIAIVLVLFAALVWWDDGSRSGLRQGSGMTLDVWFGLVRLRPRLSSDYTSPERRRNALVMVPPVLAIAVIVAVLGHFVIAALVCVGALLGLARAYS
jgi:hypothetical protein